MCPVFGPAGVLKRIYYPLECTLPLIFTDFRLDAIRKREIVISTISTWWAACPLGKQNKNTYTQPKFKYSNLNACKCY